jgi:hypothetical protein
LTKPTSYSYSKFQLFSLYPDELRKNLDNSSRNFKIFWKSFKQVFDFSSSNYSDFWYGQQGIFNQNSSTLAFIQTNLCKFLTICTKILEFFMSQSLQQTEFSKSKYANSWFRLSDISSHFGSSTFIQTIWNIFNSIFQGNFGVYQKKP